VPKSSPRHLVSSLIHHLKRLPAEWLTCLSATVHALRVVDRDRLDIATAPILLVVARVHVTAIVEAIVVPDRLLEVHEVAQDPIRTKSR